MSFVSVPGPAPRPGAFPAPAFLTPLEAGALLDGYRSAIFGFLRRKGFRAEEADDLTQETLIRAYTHLAGFRGLSLAPWLYRIATNVSIDHLRKQRLITVPLEGSSVEDAGGEDPLERLERSERRGEVLDVVGQLPECHQRVLRLRYFEDRSLEEIGGVLGCTPMAAKLRVFRAVTALRKRWRGRAVSPGEAVPA